MREIIKKYYELDDENKDLLYPMYLFHELENQLNESETIDIYTIADEEKILNIDVQDYKENVSVRFFYDNHDTKNTNEFKYLRIEKNGQNVYLPLFFIIYNLMTEASEIDLKHSFDPLNKCFIFDYSHKMWQSISLHKNTYLKTRAFIHKNMLLNIQNFLKSPNLSNLLGKYYNCFSDVILNNQHKFYLHHTHNNQQLYI